MSYLFFLPPYIVFSLFGLNLWAFWFLQFGHFLLIFIPSFLVLFFNRRNRIEFVDTIKTDGEIYLAPSFGTIKSIRQNVPIFDGAEIGHEIRISMAVWDFKGLYLPTTGEVTYLKANKGRKISREADLVSFYGSLEDVSHTNLAFTSKNGNKTLLRFVDSPNGNRPDIWLKSGDRGRGAACFGYYPLGGTLFIYLPKNSDILVFESERIIPGQTVIAAIKDQK